MKKDWKAKWTAKGAEYTHLLFSGGKLCVADAQHATFLNEYSNAIARGQTEYVVESKTPIFRLFVDFDFEPPPSTDIIEGAIKSACGVAGYYFDKVSRAVVLRKDVETPEKIGVHVTWDAIFVDPRTANAFRSHLVAKLEDACPDVEWKTVVDAAVYRPKAGSLRLPWSSKVAAPGVYVPVATCCSDGVFEKVGPITTAAGVRSWVKCTSIRAPEETLTKTCIVTSEDVAHQDESTVQLKTTAESVTEHSAALEALQTTLPEAYAHQKFTGIHRYGDHCVIARSSSKRCGNKDYEEHHTSTVYFVILKTGHAYQRCYCRKDVVRDNGVTCTDYIGPPWPLPKSVIEGFWPPVPKETQKLMDALGRTRPVLKRKKRTL